MMQMNGHITPPSSSNDTIISQKIESSAVNSVHVQEKLLLHTPDLSDDEATYAQKDTQSSLQTSQSTQSTSTADHPSRSFSQVPEEDQASDNDENQSEEDESDQKGELRHEAIPWLGKIEQEFANYKNLIYQEQVAELSKEAEQVIAGTHPEIAGMLQEIEAKKANRLAVANATRTKLETTFKAMCDAGIYQARVDFRSKRAELRRNMMYSMNSRRWELEAEKLRVDREGKRTASLLGPEDQFIKKHKTKHSETDHWFDIAAAQCFPSATVDSCSTDDIKQDLIAFGLQVPADSISPSIKVLEKSLFTKSKKLGPLARDPRMTIVRLGSSSVLHKFDSTLPPDWNQGSNSSPNVKPHAQNGILVIGQNKSFKENDQAVLSDNGAVFIVKIISIDEKEFVVQRDDGSKCHVPMELLIEKRVTLEPHV